MPITKNLNLQKILVVLSFLSVIIPSASFTQSKSITCADVTTGIFHSYPKNTSDYYVSVRDKDFQRETNVKTGDTVLYTVGWINDCTYSLKYISGSSKLKPEMQDFLKKHKVLFQVTSLNNDYYIYKAFVDKLGGDPFHTDTVWLREKINIPNNSLYELVPNPTKLKRDRFSDTSKYAILYIYRPKKVTNSLASFPVYLNDNLLLMAKNNSGYIFKVLKEGPVQLKSKLLKDESAVTVDVKFGKKYYVKSAINWGLYKRLYNFKLEMELIKPEDGAIEFMEVDQQPTL